MWGIRKSYWLIAACLLLSGLAIFVFAYGYNFSGLLMCSASLPVMLWGAIEQTKKLTCRVIFLTILIGILVMAGITGLRIRCYSKGSADPSAQYAIVMGAGVRGTEPTLALQERIQAAKAYATEYPQAILILSGCRGEEEEISEAQCMYDCLMEEGLPPTRLVMEEKAGNTEENILYSLALIRKLFSEPESVCIISSEYHLLRAASYGEEAGITTKLYPARTENRLYYWNMFLREIAGMWKFRLR
ncbi:MAG: YdcF family protein [Oscillospiraceae bacterium]|nr:YdcF family protein [Oscillospiraceae bacterium]